MFTQPNRTPIKKRAKRYDYLKTDRILNTSDSEVDPKKPRVCLARQNSFNSSRKNRSVLEWDYPEEDIWEQEEEIKAEILSFEIGVEERKA